MAIVAVIAVGMAFVMMWRRQAHHLALAERYLNTQEVDQALLDEYKKLVWMAGYRGKSNDESVRQGKSDHYWREESIRAECGVINSYRQLVYHRQMVSEHLRAAAHPWEIVSRDPAPPRLAGRKESIASLLMRTDTRTPDE